jgi:hypothetical protein
MNNVHEDAPSVFESRWALSYLRGPLGRNEIRRLTTGSPAQAAGAPAVAPSRSVAPAGSAAGAAVTNARQPVLPAGVSQYFLPVRTTGAALTYHAMVYGAAQARCVEASLKIDAPLDITVATPIGAGPVPVDWNAATPIDIAASDLEPAPAFGIGFAELPANVVTAKSLAAWSKDFTTWVYGSQTVEVLKASESGTASQPGESERDFRIRLQHATRELRDEAVEQLRKKFAPKSAAVQERMRRAEQAVGREEEQAKAQTLQTAISFGTTLLGAFMGRKAISATTLGRATTAARGVGRTLKETQDIGRAKETVEALQQQLTQLDEELRTEIAAIEARFEAASEPLEKVVCKPKKSTITVQLVALVWAPYAVSADGTNVPAW